MARSGARPVRSAMVGCATIAPWEFEFPFACARAARRGAMAASAAEHHQLSVAPFQLPHVPVPFMNAQANHGGLLFQAPPGH